MLPKNLSQPLLLDMDALRATPAFASMSGQSEDLLRQYAFRQPVAKGGRLIFQGAACPGIFFMVDGIADAVHTDSKKREAILCTYRPGSVFGESALSPTTSKSMATVRSRVPSVVLLLPVPALAELVHRDPNLALLILHGLSDRLMKANEKVRMLSLDDVQNRIAAVLEDVSEPHEDGTLRTGRISRAHLAKTIGASRDMVGRTLRAMEEKGRIKTIDNGIMLLR